MLQHSPCQHSHVAQVEKGFVSWQPASVAAQPHTPIPCTVCRWFVSVDYTDPNLVQEVYMKNHEIATHTLSHVMNPGK